MKGSDGGCLEAASHLADSVILGHLKDVSKVFDAGLGGINGEAISEDGEDKGVKDSAPIRIVEASDRVSKDTQGTHGGVRSIGHDGNMV